MIDAVVANSADPDEMPHSLNLIVLFFTVMTDIFCLVNVFFVERGGDRVHMIFYWGAVDINHSLPHDVAPGREITSCIKIDKPL